MASVPRFGSGLLSALLCALAVACGGSDGGSSGSVRFLVFGDPAEINAYRTLIDAFAEEEPDIDVQLVEASDREDLIARLSSSLSGGAPPDLFLMNYRFYGQFASRDVLEPLGPYVSDSSEFEEDDFYPQALDAFRWQGELMCVPQNISSLILYFNRDLFKRFNISPPRDGMLWNELVVKAQQLTRDKNGQQVRGADPDMPQAGTAQAAIYGLGVEPVIIRLAPFVWSNGGEVVDDTNNPTRFTLDTPQAEEALAQLFGLRTNFGVVPNDQEIEAEDAETRFINGRMAMYLDSRRATPGFREAAKFDWDITSLPYYDKPASILHSDAYCMTKAAKEKDAAWRFVEFAVGPEGAPVIAKTGRTVPSLKEVAESDDFLDPSQKPANSQAFLDAIATIQHVPTISTWPEIEDVTDGLLENGMYLGQPPQSVAAEIDRKTRPLFARGQSAQSGN
jgi:multiple sugar transport system substrate-binding protein